MLDLPIQKDRKGLGFIANQGKSVITPEGQSIPPPIQFVSGGTIQEEAHAVSEGGDSDCEMDRWVHPTRPNEKLTNWFAKDIIEVIGFEE